jgi:hypothetical protein
MRFARERWKMSEHRPVFPVSLKPDETMARHMVKINTPLLLASPPHSHFGIKKINFLRAQQQQRAGRDKLGGFYGSA